MTFRTSYYQGQVFVLDHVFHMPSFNRARKVWMYLPPDYQLERKRYPVIYMHDGQNLFDEKASFAGEWHVETSLDELFHRHQNVPIIVGIENAKDGEARIEEYSPWFNEYNKMGGRGDDYLQFIIQTLKPYIDRNFRTLALPEHTGMAGSSMGGLITLYAAIEYQNIFGKSAIFSPSLWFSDQAFSHIHSKGKNHQFHSKIYLVSGSKEPEYVPKATHQLHLTLLNAGFSNDDIHFDIVADGEHSEWFWAKEFPKAYEWLFLK